MFENKKLKNGITLISSKVKGANSITMMIMVKVGSRNETDVVFGGAHYIEHLMFKGTEKRPNTSVLSKELDSMGVDFNAFTGKEYTAYYIKGDKKNIAHYNDILFDILQNSKFELEEMEREKNVIVEEIKMYHENPLMRIDDLFEETIFEGSRLGLDIAGTKESVLNMKRNDVLNFKNTAYKPQNITVVLAGAVDESIIKLVMDQFEKFEQKSNDELFYKKYENQQNGIRINIDKRDTEQIQLVLGFHSKEYRHPSVPVLKILGNILGGNMSSRMFIEIRERLGLCYSVSAGFDNYIDTGHFCVRAGLDKHRIKEAILAIKNEFIKIKQNGITQEELKRAKDYIEGKTVLNFEDTYEWARWYATQSVMGVPLKTPQERLNNLLQVSIDDVNKLAQEIIDFNMSNLAIVGDAPSKDELKELLA